MSAKRTKSLSFRRAIRTCKYIPLTDIVPLSWNSFFYAELAQDAPFSWGDNNKTLVTATRIADHVDGFASEWKFTPRDPDPYLRPVYVKRWLKAVRDLGNTLIDLDSW